jgi:LysR family nitrogen assimilation transcriptional regulator
MDLKQLEYFVRVAELGSFTRAATLLSITQPSLSRQIRLLEVELRQALLLRNGRGVRTTEAGALLLKHARGMLLQAERARADIQEMRGVPAGRVILGMPSSVGRFLSTPLAFDFRKAFPRAKLSIVEGQTYIMEWLSLGRIDVGVLINPQPTPGIELDPLMTEPLYLVEVNKKPGARPAVGPPIALKDMPIADLLLPSRPHAIRMYLESQFARIGAPLEISWELDAFPTLLTLIRRGFGRGVMPMSALHGDDHQGHYALRQIRQPDLESSIAIATHTERPLSPLCRGAISLIKRITATTRVG